VFFVLDERMFRVIYGSTDAVREPEGIAVENAIHGLNEYRGVSESNAGLDKAEDEIKNHSNVDPMKFLKNAADAAEKHLSDDFGITDAMRGVPDAPVGAGIKSAYGLETAKLADPIEERSSISEMKRYRKEADDLSNKVERYYSALVEISRMFPVWDNFLSSSELVRADFNSLPALVQAELNLRESNEAEIKRLNAEIQRWSAELVKSEGECAELKQRLGYSQKENTALRQRLDKREDTLKELTEACNEMDSKISKLEARQNADRGFEQLSEANQRVVDALEEESAEIRSDELTHEYMLRASEVSIIEMRRMRRGIEQIVQWLARR
jgi:DNA repair exonuclease SbcCD ATPase subunit